MPAARHWLAGLVLATTALLYLVAGLSMGGLQPVSTLAHANVPQNLQQALPTGAPPAPEPLRFRTDVSPEDAVAINAKIPLSTEPNPAARPYRQAFATPADRTRAVECLTAAVYYESAMEPVDGQRAVAQVVLNRVRHPAYPKTVCGVVFQGSDRTTGCQFTFTCDGAMMRAPVPVLWTRARIVAEEAIAGKVYAPVGWSTHYHANYVVPYWSGTLAKAANVGRHIFYRWAGGWGRPPAFRLGPADAEPQIALMRRVTSDPSTLSDAPAPDALLAAQAAAAAAAAANGVPTAATPEKGGVDSLSRAIVRRYEPMTPQAATDSTMAQLNKPSPTMHWALSGLPEKPQAPLGKQPAEAAASPPHCLEGVRRLPAGGQGTPEKQGC
ncbi:MAG: cell wall hydrolase [Alphaproteobacteria bacterium]|nr:cell wall hydrolase [Alphaproteobacteria bacterium]